MKDRKTYVAELLSAKPGIAQLEISRKVKAAYGTGLSFVHIRRLRDAHNAGTFERTWSELFGLQENSPEQGGRRKKPRGDRRRKTQLRGRRNLDRDKFLLNAFNNHLVVYRTAEGVLHSEAFKSRARAEALVKELLGKGMPSEHIGYFHRDKLAA